MSLIAEIHKDLEASALQLIVEYRERLHLVALGLCKDEAQAEDLVFRTFERVLSKAASHREDKSLFCWMRSILENLHKDDQKRPVIRGTVPVEADELERCAGVDWSTDEQILKNSDSEAIRRALSGLDPKYNKVLLMRYYEDFSLKEIAEFLCLPIGTVSRRLHVAHRLLAGKLNVVMGEAKKPLAVLAAALTLVSAATAAVATVPALAPVRDTVVAWFADGSDGGTGDRGMVAPSVQVAEEDDGGTGVPPVQPETVFEPRQEDTTLTQPNTTVTKENTMNTKKMAAIAGATMLGLTASGDSVWNLNTPDPTWWFTPAAWSVYPPSGKVTLLKKADNSIANIYLQDGDEVTVKDVELCNGSYKGGNLFFQVQKGASLTFTGNMLSDAESFTNVIDIAGGTVRGNTFRSGGKPTSPTTVFVTNGADVAFASMAQGSGGPATLYIEDSTFAVTNNHFLVGPSPDAGVTRVVGKNAVIRQLLGGLYISLSLYENSQLLLEDSTLTVKGQNLNMTSKDCVMRLTNTVVTTPGIKLSSNAEFELVGDETSVSVSWEMSLGSTSKFIQRGGTMTVSKSQNTVNMFTTTSGETTGPTMEIYGGTCVMTNRHASGGVFLDLSGAGKPTFRQYGGTFVSYGAQFGATSTNVPRCEIYGGKFCAYGNVNNQSSLGGVFNKSTATKGGVFSIYGGAPEVRMQRIGTYDVTTTQPQLDYVICTNGIPTIYMDTLAFSHWDWVSGYFTIRPLGGVQLIHVNVVTLLDGTAAKRRMSCQNLDAGGMIFPNATLWKRGATSVQPAIKVTLKEAAELADGAYYEEGRSCGYLKIPTVKSNWRSVSVDLDLVPQGNETLDTLVAGFTAAGYAAKRIPGTYNVKLRIPRELLVEGSSDEKILIDFNEYADAEAVRDAQPTVRALVRRASFTHDSGFMLIIK